MKITKIEVSDFRGFPGRTPYSFDFGNARNLFIYGENGSGKSSLFRAIKEFFNRQTNPPAFATFKNNLDPAITTGHVTVHFDDGSVQSWTSSADRPLNALPASQTSLQVGCLDYRSLLETNFSQRGDNVNLFDIAVTHLVPHLEVPTPPPLGSRTIGELWRSVVISKPMKHYQSNLRLCERALKRFNDAFEPVITPLINKATELLSEFPNTDLTLGASFHPVEYDTLGRRFKNLELILSVERQGTQLLGHHNFLNEARLSSVGLVIYLAGLLVSVPGTSQYPKLLVLDDVLVGLDMANRLPVLTILEKFFADWQIILLTYDQIWYEMVQVDMDASQWQAYELWLGQDGMTPVYKPRGAGSDFFTVRAREHLANNDDRAAGMYTRAGFETKVKKYCDKRSVPVPYSKEPRGLKIEDAWRAAKAKAISAAQSGNNPTLVQNLTALFHAADLAKKVILNPLSHSTPQLITRQEIAAAIAAVENLLFE